MDKLFSLYFFPFSFPAPNKVRTFMCLFFFHQLSVRNVLWQSCVTGCIPSVVTKVITVVETVVDGRVVESSKTVDVDVDQIEWTTKNEKMNKDLAVKPSFFCAVVS